MPIAEEDAVLRIRDIVMHAQGIEVVGEVEAGSATSAASICELS